MTHYTSQKPSDSSGETFDLMHIFVGREQQLDLFGLYLDHWKNLMRNTVSDETLVTTAPSPNNKMEGLVVVLYGDGGRGKSTLLNRYHDIALRENQNSMFSKIKVSNVVDWEFAIEGRRELFNPPQGQEIDPSGYFEVLRGHLSIALGRNPKEFKEYQAAVKAVEEARKKASGVWDSLKGDDRYAALRDMAVDGLMTTLSIATPPPVGKILSNDKVQGTAREIAKITSDQLVQIKHKLHDKLGNKLGDFLEPALRLGLALGRDLCKFSKNLPLLIFFDTYEEIDEGDRLLRMVIGAAGLRVGWVIAGRDNLWAGSEQRERSTAMEYGYKDLVSPDRGLSVNFNADDVGAFTLSDIMNYFDLVHEKVRCEPPLPKVTEEEAKSILEVTQGVPLAVKIAAGLYVEMVNLDAITEKIAGKKEIVDQMVRRYLLHTRVDQSERAKLYGLAMLRRTDQPYAVASALGLTDEEAKTIYRSELSHLHRRYSFIFTEKEEPSLHKEVRTFLRLWLQERYDDPEIVAVNERLKEAHEAKLKELGAQRKYSTLKARCADEKWVGIYLDLMEQQFWLDPVEGVRSTLPFLIAAAVYCRPTLPEAIKVGEFFKSYLEPSYLDWWKKATRCLHLPTFLTPSQKQSNLKGLKELENLVRLRSITFPQLIPDYQEELEAILWWLLGDTYKAKRNPILGFLVLLAATSPNLLAGRAGGLSSAIPAILKRTPTAFSKKDTNVAENENRALECYEKALNRLGQETRLRKSAAETYLAVSDRLYKEKKYTECISLLKRALELKPDYFKAYEDRGHAYYNLKEYQLAIEDYTRVLKLDSKNATIYLNRGNSYAKLKEYKQAITDFTRAHELDPQNVDAAWMTEWVGMGRECVSPKATERLEEIAKIDPQHYSAYLCQGLVLGLRGKLKEGLTELEQAILLNPENPDAYFWKGILCAYYYPGRSQSAIETIEKSLSVGLPSVLLTPLYWLEKDRPDFFDEYARPLLEQHNV